MSAPPTASEGVTVQDPAANRPSSGTALGSAVPDNPTDTTEVVTKGHTMNMLDPFLYKNFFTLATPVWSTSDTPGKIIWFFEIKPENTHENMKTLMRMYNIWAGDFQFALKLAGTGFHGGALALIYTPPNIDPNILNQANFTYFDYTLIDPKMQDISSFEGKDTRNVGFHWEWNRDAQEPNSFFGKVAARGGYLTMMVYLPLIASSTGNDQVNLAILSRLAPNFRVGQMIPISATERPLATKADILGTFEKAADRNIPLVMQGAKGLICSTQSTEPYRGNDFLHNIRTGKIVSKDSCYVPGMSVLHDEEYKVNVELLETKFWALGAADLDSIRFAWFLHHPGFNYVDNICCINLSNAVERSPIKNNIVGANPKPTGMTLLTRNPAEWGEGKHYVSNDLIGTPAVQVYQDNFAPNNITFPERDVITQRLGEGIIYFAGETTETPDKAILTLDPLQHIFRQAPFSDVPIEFDPLFEVYDTVSNLPLFNCRLNPEGYFSTNAFAANTNFDLSKIGFRYLGLTSANSALQNANKAPGFIKAIQVEMESIARYNKTEKLLEENQRLSEKLKNLNLEEVAV